MTTPQETAPRKGNFVLLTAGNLQLLLPQEDVGVADYLAEPPEPTEQPGVFAMHVDDEGVTHYVAALSPRMTLLAALPPERFLLTMFPAQPGVWMCWDDVNILIDTEITPHALPPAMIGPDSPLTAYVELGDKLAFLCSAERLLAQTFPARS
jgi:hypothetical protein